MLLVVLTHLLTFCTHVGPNDNIILRGLEAIRMPSFFCISGFFAYGVYNGKLFKKRFSNRLACQLWPTIILFICFTFYSKKTIWEGVTDEYKYGYWFTYSMVLIWTLYAIISFLVTKFSISKRFEYCIYVTLTLILMYLHLILDTTYEAPNSSLFARIICLGHIRHLIPYFFIGVFLRMNYEVIEKLLFNMNKLKGSVVVCCLLILFYISMPYSLKIREIIGLFMVLILFYNFRNFLSSNNQIVSYLRFIGQNTLPIYLLHYFFIDTFTRYEVFKWIFSVNTWYLFLPILLLVSFCVAESCLFVHDLLKTIPHLYKFIFGKKPNHNNYAIIMTGINMFSLRCFKAVRFYS